jgi:hypothetical protein
MSSLRLAKLAQLMKEAKEQYFNLYNDMNDSIYVEQKGRTVGDVEVLPGKTLSGCITSSNLTVYYTNLMGGKDSKVISSNELITLLPSLTTKKGELSPTLNISKVLIDISIKKYNSANKLAGMRKVADGTDGTEQNYEEIEFPPVEKGETKEQYIYNAQEGRGSSQNDESLGHEYDRQVSATSTPPAPSSSSSSPRSSGSTGSSTKKISYIPLTGNLGTVKIEPLTNGETITYTILGPYEFSYVWKDSSGNEKKKSSSVKTSYSGWNKAVATINNLPSQSAPAATPTAAPAATAPAATSEPAPAAQGQREVPVTNLVTNVAKILSNVDAGHTYALKTSANERRMVRRMLRAIDGMPAALKTAGVVNSSLALAKVIVGAGGVTNDSNLAKADPSTVASMKERDIERTFAPELETIMRAVVRLYTQIKDDPNKLSSYIAIKVPNKTDAPTPPAAASGSTRRVGVNRELTLGGGPEQYTSFADNGSTVDKKSSLDPRIKKLAKLRRLKVRGQMESAIEPSAKFGRSRVS